MIIQVRPGETPLDALVRTIMEGKLKPGAKEVVSMSQEGCDCYICRASRELDRTDIPSPMRRALALQHLLEGIEDQVRQMRQRSISLAAGEESINLIQTLAEAHAWMRGVLGE